MQGTVGGFKVSALACREGAVLVSIIRPGGVHNFMLKIPSPDSEIVSIIESRNGLEPLSVKKQISPLFDKR